jgi:hypothetical protein
MVMSVGVFVGMVVSVVSVGMDLTSAAAIFTHNGLPFFNFKFNGCDVELASRNQFDVPRTTGRTPDKKRIVGWCLMPAGTAPDPCCHPLDDQLGVRCNSFFRYQREDGSQRLWFHTGERADRNHDPHNAERLFFLSGRFDLFDQRLCDREFVH